MIKKTYTKSIVVTKPLLEIRYDQNAQSPRDGDNLGYFITCEKRYNSPDDNEELKSLIQNLSEESNSTDEHIAKIKKEMPFNGYGKVLAIYPVNRYEHGNVYYYSVGKRNGFDYSNCGFYIVTDKTSKYHKEKKKDYLKLINTELEIYNSYINGDVYEFTLFDKEGEVIDSCSGFYSLDDIKDSLPKEWKKENLSDYIIHN